MVRSEAPVVSGEFLRVARRTNACTVLGPGRRAVVWVQGCPLNCPGCVAVETHAMDAGEIVAVDQLAAEYASLPIDGVTLSGGEPMLQAEALTRLIDGVWQRRDLSFMCYSGLTLPFLKQHGTPAQHALLERLDILVDGPYLRERPTRKRWRGSNNQKVHFLSPRHRSLSSVVEEEGDWIDVEVTPAGTMLWMGIPPGGFREAVEQQLAQRGIVLEIIA